MLDFFSSISNAVTLLFDYLVGLITAITTYFALLFESSIFLGEMVGYLPTILQVCGQVVIGAAIFKAIFGRQGAS